MSMKSIVNLIKPIGSVVEKSVPLIKSYGGKTVRFVSTHKFGAGVTAFAGILAVDDIKVRKSRNREREKNKAYQEILKKHQAQIDALKSAKEREEYKNKLWEELISKSKE